MEPQSFGCGNNVDGAKDADVTANKIASTLKNSGM